MESQVRYIPRPLGAELLNCHSKVVVLEGARAVGKTMLVQHELVPRGFEYYSLSDYMTYEYASRNVTEWVNSLRLPAIIDEAQLIPRLPLAVKERADSIGANSPQFVLTGSASINRDGLSGQDPLTRRAVRFSLSPLTVREVRMVPENLVDALFDCDPRADFDEGISRQELYSRMELGGFPGYVTNARFMGARERSLSIRSDINSVLGDNVQPGERLDGTIAGAVLNRLLALPGDILNISKLANEVGANDRTIKRYISIFLRRYLIRSLPNLKLAAHRQDYSRSKIHPIDTSFSCEVMNEAGRDPLRDSILFGHLFESFVINQIVPSAQWSAYRPNAFFWRETTGRNSEVDLVLLAGDKMIGVEVKSSSSVGEDDFAGLRRLAKDPRFRRGFVFYTGSKVVRQSYNMWAMPVSALWRSEAFGREAFSMDMIKEGETSVGMAAPEKLLASVDARVVLSYNRKDNEYLDGAIVALADRIAEEYHFQYGSAIDLFVDTKSINWGEDWQQVLNSAIETSTFIMPAVTPGYLASAPCRDELNKFVSRSESQINGHVLSLVWQQFEGTVPAIQNPQAAETIKRYQYVDISELRDLDSSDRTYKQKVRELVRKIRKHVEDDRRKGSQGMAASNLAGDEKEETGLIDRLEQLNTMSTSLHSHLAVVGSEAQKLSEVLADSPVSRNSDAKQLKTWALTVEGRSKGHAEVIKERLVAARGEWDGIVETVRSYLEMLNEVARSGAGTESVADATRTLRVQLVSLRDSFSVPQDTQSALSAFGMIRVLSPRLSFLGDVFQEMLNTIQDMRAATDDLIDQLDEMS